MANGKKEPPLPSPKENASSPYAGTDPGDIVARVSSCIFIVDPHGSILFTNRSAQELFGDSENELIGSSFTETLVSGTEKEGCLGRTDMEEMLKNLPTQQTFIQQNIRKDNMLLTMQWSADTMPDNDPDTARILLTGTDITLWKRAENESARYRHHARRMAHKLITTEEQSRRDQAAYIHDNIIQLLSLSTIRLGGLLPVLESCGSGEDAGKLQDVRGLLNEAVAQCRAMIDQLVPAMLFELGPGVALENFAEKHRAMGACDIHIEDCLGDLELPPNVASILFRSAQEFLMNALKYSAAKQINIILAKDGPDACVTVSDNGIGFDTGKMDKFQYDENGGFGLFDIGERVNSLNGQMVIESSVNSGTIVSVRIPLHG